jgi:predicted O-methyltransferase YrrM
MFRFTSYVARAALAANLAFIIRGVRFGLGDAVTRLASSYRLMDPFVPRQDEIRRKEAEADRLASKALYRSIETVHVNRLVSRSPRITVDCRFVEEDGSLPVHELVPLLMILRDEDPRSVLEIGTFFGSTTANLALNVPEATVSTVDLPQGLAEEQLAAGELQKDDFHLINRRRVGHAYRGVDSIDNIIQHFGDTATWDFSLAGPETSFFFIDGSHTYEYVKNDTVECLSLAERESVILWHDVDPGHPGVVRWLGEMIAAGFPIKRVEGTNLGYLKFDPEKLPTAWIDARRLPGRRPGDRTADPASPVDAAFDAPATREPSRNRVNS